MVRLYELIFGAAEPVIVAEVALEWYLLRPQLSYNEAHFRAVSSCLSVDASVCGSQYSGDCLTTLLASQWTGRQVWCNSLMYLCTSLLPLPLGVALDWIVSCIHMYVHMYIHRWYLILYHVHPSSIFEMGMGISLTGKFSCSHKTKVVFCVCIGMFSFAFDRLWIRSCTAHTKWLPNAGTQEMGACIHTYLHTYTCMYVCTYIGSLLC